MAGAVYLEVGRPINQATNPVEIIEAMPAKVAAALG